MNNLGAFQIEAVVGQLPLTGQSATTVPTVQYQQITPTNLLRAGFVEIINRSPYILSINLSGITIIQEDWSKAVYPVQQAGQQLQIQPQPTIANQNNANASLASNIVVGGYNALVIINNYETGEISWYPPISLPPAIPSVQQQFGYQNYQISSKSNINGSPLVIPGSTAQQTIYLLGFDLTCQLNSTTSFTFFTISPIITNFFQITNNSLFYVLNNMASYTTTIFERFPVPVALPAGNTTCSIGTFNGSIALNVYWIAQ